MENLPPVFQSLAGINSRGLGEPTIERDSSTEQSHDSSLTWTRIHPEGIVPQPRSGAASCVVDGKLWVFGGYGQSHGGGRLDDFYCYDFEENNWSTVEVLGDKPSQRENNGVVVSNNPDGSKKMLLFGGYSGSEWLNDLWSFDFGSRQWTLLHESSDPSTDDENATAPSRRFGYVSMTYRNKFLVWGGFSGDTWLNDMFEFDFSSMQWREVTGKGCLPSPRSCPAYVQDDSYVFLHGGFGGEERKNDFFVFDLSTYEWKEIPPKGNVPTARYFHSCCLWQSCSLYGNQRKGKKLIVYAGYNGSQRLDDMYFYCFDSKEWSKLESGGQHSPSGRSSLVAQVYTNHLFCCFGYDGTRVLNDFYKFNLKTTSILLPSLRTDMKSLIDNEQLADCTFLVEGHEIHANRAILAVRSEYFHALLFGSSMRESIQDIEEAAGGTSAFRRRPIEMHSVSYEVFMKILEYLYTDSIQDLDTKLGIELLITSEQFMLDRLKALCEDIIRRDLNVDNVCQILAASHQQQAEVLKEITLDFLVKNLSNPTIMQGLSDLKTEPDLLVEIIRRNASANNDNRMPSSPFAGSDWTGTRR